MGAGASAFACAHLLRVSEGLDHGGKGLLHLGSLKHKFEWKQHLILLLKLTEGGLKVASSPAQGPAPAREVWAQGKWLIMSAVKGADQVMCKYLSLLLSPGGFLRSVGTFRLFGEILLTLNAGNHEVEI